MLKLNVNRFMLRNYFLLGTVCIGLLYSGSVRASTLSDIKVGSMSYYIKWDGSDTNPRDVIVYPYSQGGTYELMDYENTPNELTYNFFDAIKAKLPNITDINLKQASIDPGLENYRGNTYYTDISYNNETGDLVFTNKLVNQSTLDQALHNAGIDDMLTKTEADGTYAKSDDVYSKTEADGKYATQDAISDILTKTEADDTYAKADDVYSKTEADGKYATQDAISDMLTKTEADGTYAKSDNVYSKTEADGK